jgi:hypothetical protein
MIDTSLKMECFNCHLPRDVQKCTACLSICYCSSGCQKSSWPDHKLTCKLLGANPTDPGIKDFLKITNDLQQNTEFARIIIALHTLPEILNEQKSVIVVTCYDNSAYSTRTSIIRKIAPSLAQANEGEGLSTATFFYLLALVDSSILKQYLKTFPKSMTEQVKTGKYFIPVIREDGIEMHVLMPKYQISDPENPNLKQVINMVTTGIKGENNGVMHGEFLFFCLNRLPTTVPVDQLKHLPYWGCIKSNELWTNITNCFKQNLLNGN